jgi:hypothetical protein
VDRAHVYWTSRNAPAIGDDLIGRANLDGTAADPSFIRGASRPVGVAVDSGPGATASLRLGKVKRHKRRGTATLTARVSGPGKLKLRGKGLRKAAKRAAGSGKVKLPVRTRGKKRRKLDRTGRARVRARVAYTPDGGEPVSDSKRIRLVKR